MVERPRTAGRRREVRVGRGWSFFVYLMIYSFYFVIQVLCLCVCLSVHCLVLVEARNRALDSLELEL